MPTMPKKDGETHHPEDEFLAKGAGMGAGRIPLDCFPGNLPLASGLFPQIAQIVVKM